MRVIVFRVSPGIKKGIAMKNARPLVERVQAGEFDNPFLSEGQDPARLMFEQQIRTLQRYLDALEKARSALPRRTLSPTYVQAEVDRKERLRAALEETFDMEGHGKADLLWDRAWGLGEETGPEQVVLLYATLLELVK
jgi:hypothetical protein